MLATLGDLIEDIAVHVAGPVNVASDTTSFIERRRGGSAANVAERAALDGHAARFIGQVGSDAIGEALVNELAAAGVDTSSVRRAGTTGTIIVLVDPTGERTMLTDRRACADLTDPDPTWLDNVTTLHVPLYSLIGGATADTARTVVGWAHDRGIAVSIDASSTALIDETGPDAVRQLLTQLRPTVLFANADEAPTLGVDTERSGAVGGAITVVKRGADPAVVVRPGDAAIEVPVPPVADVSDTTGAGDAFAAGFLTAHRWSSDPVAACRSGHAAANRLLTGRHRP